MLNHFFYLEKIQPISAELRFLSQNLQGKLTEVKQNSTFYSFNFFIERNIFYSQFQD